MSGYFPEDVASHSKCNQDRLLVFEAKAAAASVLGYSRSSIQGNGNSSPGHCTRQLREHFGLTLTELAYALGVSPEF
jgi:hypothetical protein